MSGAGARHKALIRFRPLLVPTLVTAAGLVLCTGLGIWQLQRLEWKEALIATMQARIAAPAISLDEALALGPQEAEWRHVRVTGRFLYDKEAYLFAPGPDGAPGLHVITPLMGADGSAVLIDRGFVPERLRDPDVRGEGQVAGEVSVSGVLRANHAPGIFTPEPDLVSRLWFARDAGAMAAALGVHIAAPLVIEADSAPNPGGWPLGGGTRLDIPNDHLGYALTWFGLALALLAVYLVYHRRQGRL